MPQDFSGKVIEEIKMHLSHNNKNMFKKSSNEDFIIKFQPFRTSRGPHKTRNEKNHRSSFNNNSHGLCILPNTCLKE